MRFQSDETMNVLYNNGILMQVNASFFCELWTRRTAVSMLWNRGIHFIGSDCHNLTSRPPRLGKAFDYIEKKLGKNFLSKLGELGNSFIAQK
jgi:protein-tyrosine phosphatase